MTYGTTKTNIVNIALSKLGSSRIQIGDFDTDNGDIANQVKQLYDFVLQELVRMHSWNCCKRYTKMLPYYLKLTNSGATRDEVNILKFDIGDLGYYGKTNKPDDEIGGYYDCNWVSLQGTYFNLSTQWLPENVEFRLQDQQPEYAYYSSSSYAPSFPFTFTSGDLTPQYPTINLADGRHGYTYDFAIPRTAMRVINLYADSQFQYPLRWSIDFNKTGSSRISTNFSDAVLLFDQVPTPVEMDSMFTSAFTTLLASRLATPLTGSRDLSLSLLNEFNNVILPEAKRINGFENAAAPEIDSAWLEATFTSSGLYNNSWPPFAKSSYGSFE